jgi:MSHA biogenesis protein MshP
MKNVRGFALVSAIFILVVLAALGAFILNISTNQQIGSALDVQGVRAYQAARAGIEWGVYQVQSSTGYRFGYDCPTTDTGSQCPNRRSCTAASGSASGSFPVFGFTVDVTCFPSTPAVSGEPIIYTITATACSTTGACPNPSPGNLYVERRLTVTF